MNEVRSAKWDGVKQNFGSKQEAGLLPWKRSNVTSRQIGSRLSQIASKFKLALELDDGAGFSRGSKQRQD